jgi:hypothetical protein
VKSKAILVFLIATASVAQQVETAPLVKNPPPNTVAGMTLLVTLYPSAIYACPKGFDMFIKNVRPKQGPYLPPQNYELFIPAPKAILNSVEGHEYKAICLKGY